MRMSPEERFWAKVDRSGDCWLWTASQNVKGYGQFKIGGERRVVRAHRYAYELLVGPIPEGLELDHLCRVRHCVNPAHLEPVTHQENMRRGEAGKHWREKIRCPQGHPYDKENTWTSRHGSRSCKACGRERHQIRRRAAVMVSD